MLVAQKSKIKFLNEQNKKPIIGLQIFSENGSFIGSTDSMGEYELDIKLLQQAQIKSILAYNTDYTSLEYMLSEIPPYIYLRKNDVIKLEPVVIKAHSSKEYFTLKGFFRSWQLLNGKLVKYGDGQVIYQVPYALVENDFNTGVKNYFTNYRTFRVDSIKQKSRIISISTFDDYLAVSTIPKNDLLKRGSKQYNVNLLKDSYCLVYKDEKEVGFAIKDENNNFSEINISTGFEGNESTKILFWKISGKYKEIEKWVETGNARHPSYLFNSSKIVVKTRIEGKFNDLETITEIFIDEEFVNGAVKPEKYKTSIDKDRSFYNSKYWDEQLIKYPLPSAIKLQLTNVNENKNIY